jgi:adenine/guanine/hypoxanthine permease
VFVIERKLAQAAGFAAAGAVLTYFGFMHGEAVGIGGGFGVTPSVALAYAAVAVLLFAFSRRPAAQPAAMPAGATAVPAE